MPGPALLRLAIPRMIRHLTLLLVVLLLATACSRKSGSSDAAQSQSGKGDTYVGAWKGVSHGNIYTVQLHEDGTFVADPHATAKGRRLTGRWGVNVSERTMWWIYNEQPNPERSRQGGYDDINRIVPGNRNHFELIEADGSHTTYDRIVQ